MDRRDLMRGPRPFMQAQPGPPPPPLAPPGSLNQPLVPLPLVGDHFLPAFLSPTATSKLLAVKGLGLYAPIAVGLTVTVDWIGMTIAVAGSGFAYIYMGLYSADPKTSRPGALIEAGPGALGGNSSGFSEMQFATPIILQPGLYYIMAVSTATPTTATQPTFYSGACGLLSMASPTGGTSFGAAQLFTQSGLTGPPAQAAATITDSECPILTLLRTA